MGSYSHKYWSCPYYSSDERLCLRCEGGRVRFETHEELADYADSYCADPRGWKECSLAQMLNKRNGDKENGKEG